MNPPSEEDKQCFTSSMRSLALTAAITAAVAGIMVVLFVVIFEEEGHWSGYTNQICDEYCENSHQCDHDMEDRPTIQQPANSWSNMAFVFVGLWPAVAIRVDLSTIVFLVANLYAGIGSFLFHASISTFWQQMDIAGMYVLMTTLVAHGLHALTDISWRWLVIPIVALGVLTPFFKEDMDEIHLHSTNVFYIIAPLLGLFVALLAGARIRCILRGKQDHHHVPEQEQGINNQRGRNIWKVILLAALPGVLFLSAVLIRHKDYDKSWCKPDSFIQGHAVWHCLTASANLLVWLFFDYHRLRDMLDSAVPLLDDNPEADERKANGHDEGVIEENC